MKQCKNVMFPAVNKGQWEFNEEIKRKKGEEKESKKGRGTQELEVT